MQLRHSKSEGLGVIARIAAGTADPEFTKAYLGGSIRYDLGAEEKRGLALFGEYLTRMEIFKNHVNIINYF